MSLLAQLKQPLNLSENASLTSLKGGAVNHIWRLQDEHRRFVVKWLGDDDFSGVNRQQQFLFQQQLAKAGMAAKPVFLNEDETLWVEAWLMPSQNADDMRFTELLAKTLARIHRIKIDAPVLDIPSRWHWYINKAGLPDAHPVARKANRLIEDYRLHCVPEEQLAFCHNDLSIGHILSASPLKVIDWEYGAMGNRYFDIAGCSLINNLSPNQHHDLCISYAHAANVELQTVLDCVSIQDNVARTTNELWHLALNGRSSST